MPLVSVDLVIDHDGGVIFGTRENEPAKGEWFVPGGTVFKNESRTDAVRRVAEGEFGDPVVIDACFGTDDRLYQTADVDGIDSKHSLATGYRCRFERDDPAVVGDDRHGAFRGFRPSVEEFRPHVTQYLDDRSLDAPARSPFPASPGSRAPRSDPSPRSRSSRVPPEHAPAVPDRAGTRHTHPTASAVGTRGPPPPARQRRSASRGLRQRR